MIAFGLVKPGTTLYIPFNTFDSNDPSASVAIAAFIVGDIEIYKDGGTTQRASDTGVTLLDTDGIDFDGHVGIGGFSIDLSSNATAGFFAAGSRYFVVVGPTTVDAAVVNFVACTFEIGYPDAVLNTTMATRASATSFTLANGSTDDDVYNGSPIIIHNVASAYDLVVGYILDYTGGTKTVTLQADPGVITSAATDHLSILSPVNVRAWNNIPLVTTNPLPNAASDAAGGLPVSDAGGLDLDTQLAATNEVTAARMGALTDWINGGRLDLLVDAIKAVTDLLPDAGALSTIGTDTARLTAVRAAVLTDWIDGGRLDLLLDAIPTTAMRGTDNAALASVLGALTDAAAAGDPTTADTAIQYLKQLINTLEGAVGIPVFPAAADPANNVSLAEAIRAIRDDVTGLAGAAMRGTDSAALASVATEARLAELDAANLPTDIAAIPTTAMRGTDNVVLAGPTKAEMDTAHALLATPAQVNTEVVDVIKTDTITLPGQAAPPLTPTLEEAVAWLYKTYRNRTTQTATLWQLMADDEATVDSKATVSDDTTTAIKQEIVSGP